MLGGISLMGKRKPSLYHSYEDYGRTSACYDETRTAVGVGEILEILTRGGIRLEQAHVLDAGCGTGNYLVALRDTVLEPVGLEFNKGMLARARSKTEGMGNVRLLLGSVLAMPIGDGKFEAAMFNQVIHHLDAGGGRARGDWPNLAQALRETRRVLRDGGGVVINTCTPEQVRDGSWYSALIPEATERLARRYVAVATLVEMLADAGFVDCRAGGPAKAMFFGRRALDPAGPFDERWRGGDSLWSLATPTELAAGLAKLRELHDAGRAGEFVRSRDRLREVVGQSVFVEGWRR